MHMYESETTIVSNWKLIRDAKAGRRGASWEEVTFTLEFVALKGLRVAYFLYTLLILIKKDGKTVANVFTFFSPLF